MNSLQALSDMFPGLSDLRKAIGKQTKLITELVRTTDIDCAVGEQHMEIVNAMLKLDKAIIGIYEQDLPGATNE